MSSVDQIEQRLRRLTGLARQDELDEIGYLLDICSYGHVSRKEHVQFVSKFGERTISGTPFFLERQVRNCPDDVYDRLVRLWIERAIQGCVDLNIDIPFGLRSRSFGRQVLEALFFPALNSHYQDLRTICFRSELRLSRAETDVMAAGIAKMHGVRRLSFVDCGKLWPDVFKDVEQNRTLSELIVIHTEITDLQSFFHFVSRSLSLRTLKLVRFSLPPAVSFMPLLHSYDLHLTTLDLNMSRRIAPDCLQNLCRALQQQQSLVSLNLSGCGIDDSQLEELCSALASNDVLQYLSLSSNNITSCAPLFQLFCCNRTLISCSLASNPVASSPCIPEFSHLLAVRKYNLACRQITLFPLLLALS